MKLRLCGSKSGGNTAGLLAISVTKGPGRPAVEPKPQPPQNWEGRRRGAWRVPLAALAAWLPRSRRSLRASMLGPAGQNHCLPGIEPEADRPGGEEMGGRLRKPPTPVKGGARSGNLDLQPRVSRRSSLTTTEKTWTGGLDASMWVPRVGAFC